MHGRYAALPPLELQELQKSGDCKKAYWIRCPVCNNKTRIKIRDDTILKNFPLYCPKCKHETLINEEQLHIEIIAEPDA